MFTDSDRYEGPLCSGAGPGASGVGSTTSVDLLDATTHIQKHNSHVVWKPHVHGVMEKSVFILSVCLHYSRLFFMGYQVRLKAV